MHKCHNFSLNGSMGNETWHGDYWCKDASFQKKLYKYLIKYANELINYANYKYAN